MQNLAWRQHVHVEVGNLIAAHHHCAIRAIELCNHCREHMLGLVNVVAVEPNHKASATWVVNSQIPATANTEVGALRNDVHHTFVTGKLVDGFGGAIG